MYINKYKIPNMRDRCKMAGSTETIKSLRLNASHKPSYEKVTNMFHIKNINAKIKKIE